MTPNPPLALIIEDEANIAEIIRSALNCVGLKTVTASSAAEGLECLQTSSPDLILLDLMLPDINGYSFLDLLHESEMDEIPIVIVSGCVSPEAQKLGFALGARDYITKPFRIQDLVTRVQRALETSPGKPRAAEAARLRKKRDSESKAGSIYRDGEPAR